MSGIKEQRDDDAVRPSEGNTVTAQGEASAPKARTPNEHDESADSQATDNPAVRRTGEIAHDAVVQGQQDTSKEHESDADYRQLRKDAASAPQPARKGDGSGR